MKNKIFSYLYRCLVIFIVLGISDFLSQKFFQNNFLWQLGFIFVFSALLSPLDVFVLKKMEERFPTSDEQKPTSETDKKE